MANKNLIDKKIIAVSTKRRLTIPKKFYSNLKIGNQVECFTRGNEIVLRPVSSEDFTDLITAELQTKGVSDKNFPAELSRQKAELKNSLDAMILDAKNLARGEGECSTFGDIFGDG